VVAGPIPRVLVRSVDALERHLDRMEQSTLTKSTKQNEKGRQVQDDAAQTANLTKEKRNEDQSD